MPQQGKVSGKWRHTRARIRLSGTWKDIPQGYIKIGDIWKPIYSFFWETENWSSCSASCGGGTQSRGVRCKRSDGQYYEDIVCTRYVGIKPSMSQPCNTHSCITCQYDGPTPDNLDWNLSSYITGNGIERFAGEDAFSTYDIGEEWHWNGKSIWGDAEASNNQTTESVNYNGCTYTRGAEVIPWGTYSNPYGGYSFATWYICEECSN